MNKYLLLTTISIVPMITFIEPSQSFSLCYLIDANGNQVNLGFVCDVIKPTTPTNSTATTPPPPTATNNPPVSPTENNTATPAQTPENVANPATKPEEEKPQLSPAQRTIPLLRNQNTPTTTTP